MELRHLRSFVILAEELHFARAADRLHMAQPALSTQIQSLERHLGARLFHRSKRSAVMLTAAGGLFLEEARKTIEQAARAELVGRRAGRGELGQVEIGYVASATFSGILPALAYDFRVTHPGVELRLHEMETPRQLEQLAQGDLDIGFLRSTPDQPEGICSVRLLSEPLLIALRNDHPIAEEGLGTVSGADLAAESFVIPQFDEEGGFEERLKVLAALGGFEPVEVHRVRDFLTALSLVGAGFGVALVPASLRSVQIAGIVYRPLSDALNAVDLMAAFRHDERAPAVRDFIFMLRRASIRPLQTARSA
jgi:DNA-binding transcriptional LysR family regulator